jgi:hypothetical protein
VLGLEPIESFRVLPGTDQQATIRQASMKVVRYENVDCYVLSACIGYPNTHRHKRNELSLNRIRLLRKKDFRLRHTDLL